MVKSEQCGKFKGVGQWDKKGLDYVGLCKTNRETWCLFKVDLEITGTFQARQWHDLLFFSWKRTFWLLGREWNIGNKNGKGGLLDAIVLVHGIDGSGWNRNWTLSRISFEMWNFST